MNENKKSKTREKKEKLVAEIADKVKRAKAMVFANYQGMTHKQLEELKKTLKKADAELDVTKNTLLLRALESENLKIDLPLGPTATIFAYSDIISTLKDLAKFIKSLNLPVIKLGIMEGQTLTVDQVIKLSTLPSREVLLAQMVFGMKSPIYGLHRALNWNLQKFVMTLDQIKNQKSKIKNT